MTNMDIAKQIAAVALVVLLGAAWALGIALAEESIAIFYGDKFQEKKTAGGEVYDKYALTSAGKTRSYRTNLRVTELENSKSAGVATNDRIRTAKPAVADAPERAPQELGFPKTRVQLDAVK